MTVRTFNMGVVDRGLFCPGSILKIYAGRTTQVGSGRVLKIMRGRHLLGMDIISGILVDDGSHTYIYDAPDIRWDNRGFYMMLRPNWEFQMELARITQK